MLTAHIISHNFNKRVQSFKFVIAVIHILQQRRVHPILTHTSDLTLAEISKPSYYCTETSSGTSSFIILLWPRGNTTLQGMAAAVLVASMEALIKTTLTENKIQFQTGTMIAIIAAEVMVMLMNLCFYLQIRHLLSTVMMEPSRRYVLGMCDLAQLFVHFDDADSRNINSCSGNRPEGPCNHNHEFYF